MATETTGAVERLTKDQVFTAGQWVQYREQKIADVLAEYDNVNMTNLRLGVAEEIYETPYGQAELVRALLAQEKAD